ncbi:MAG TPA: SMC family ATPase [Candidatus Obscuribacterales bacterium]
MENFMAYSQAELDFRSFRIACLAGNNGAGKSTVLDAITWALFDTARAHDSEDLIRLGASEMRVELNFALEGQVYRIIRTRKRKGKGKSSGKATLEFQLKSEEGYRSLSGKKIQESQQRIEQTLRMNYQLFVNSSFILQGRADAFTTASPAERKKVLADILQLDAYERIRVEALELKRELRAREVQLRSQSARLEEDLQAREHLEAHLGDSRQHQLELAQALDTLQQQAEELDRESEKRRHLEIAIEHLERQQADLSARCRQQQQQVQDLQTQQGNLQRWLDHRAQIEAGFGRLQQAEAGLREQESAFEHYRGLEAADGQLRQTLSQKQHQLEMQAQTANHALQTLEQEWQRLAQTLAEAAKINQGHAHWREALDEESRLLKQQARWHELERSHSQLSNELGTGQQRFEIKRQSLQSQLDEIVTRLAGEAALRAEQTALGEQLERLLLKQARLENVQTRGLELKHEQENLERESARLDQQLAELRTRRERLIAHKDSVCPLCERLLTAADLDLLLDKYALDFDKAETERLAIKPQIDQLESEIQRMRKQYQDLARELKPRDSLQTRLGTVSHSLELIAQARDKQTELTAEAARLHSQWQAKEAELNQRLQLLDQELAGLSFRPEELGLVQARIRDWQWAESRQRELSQAQHAAPAVSQRREAADRALAELNAQFSAFSAEMQSQLSASQTELAALSEVPLRRTALQAEIAELETFRERHAKLQEASIRMESVASQLSELDRAKAETTEALGKLAEELATRKGGLAGNPERAQQRQLIQIQLDTKRQAEKQVHAEIFSLEKELETLLQRQSEFQAQQQEISHLLYEIQLYEVLEDSFGKNGLQAVLIENALPEIEQIANDMLASMSEGRMHIKLQTLRSYKTRDKLAETLDILISDELGTRNYETFSAGEAFRVNFALRLAISKLLARRAGARLQTLVIDEGFGSQDSEGKTRLIEAINAVAPDFAAILVITHVDELKALFPCRIEVSKEAGGSELKILHV